ncbi:ficolin-2-like [Asterias amurensis]|uniref:ficolin-2-like n=1 Tax=Asterias amurensis TaxID=7602 RepID=UPI003AB3A6E9
MDSKALFSFCVVFITLSNQNFCSFQPTTDFFGAKYRALQGFVLSSTKAVSSVTCVRDCMIDPRCVSINYFDSEKRCELNSATKTQFPGSFTYNQRSFYYDEDRGTTLLPEFASCKELLHAAGGNISSGVYTIFPSNLTEGLEVYCDMEGNDGGWIVFQRRQDGSVDFYLNWADYQRGFGDLKGEFWLGNDNLRALTEASPQGTWELRINMEDWDGEAVWVDYSDFKITGDKYTLNAAYKSTGKTDIGDSLDEHIGQPYTTKDCNNGGSMNCAQQTVCAWWYEMCHTSNLTGEYYNNPTVEHNQGLQWETWKGDNYSLKNCSMKIREIN